MEAPTPGFFFSSSPVLLFSPRFFFLSTSHSLCFPFLLPSACASLCLCTVFVSYLAKLEKFTWKQDEDNGVLWIALFPFSLAFPLVNSFYSFAFPSYWYFFFLHGSSEFASGMLEFWRRFYSPSPLFPSPCCPVLPHVSLSFFILPVLSLFLSGSPSSVSAPLPVMVPPPGFYSPRKALWW